MYDFDTPVNRKNTDCSKWDNMSSMFTQKDLLPLWIADMDFKVCDEITQAIVRRAEHGVFGYTVLGQEYYDALAGWMRRRHGWKIERDWVTTSVTVVSALNIMVQCYTAPGDGIIIQKPVYFPFEECVLTNGRKLANNALVNNDGYYTMDFADLEQKAADPQNKMMILCSPHNPVCRAWKREELARVADICERNNVILVSDEVHGDFVYGDNRFLPMGTITGYQKVVTCTAPSKTFNLAGLKLANIIIPDEDLRKRFNQRSKSECGIVPNNPLSIEGVKAAYAHGDRWVDEAKAYIYENYLFLKRQIEKELPMLKVTLLEATFLAWVDFAGTGLRGESLSDFLRNRAKVGLDEGFVFGKEGETYARINLATNRLVVKECLERIQNSL